MDLGISFPYSKGFYKQCQCCLIYTVNDFLLHQYPDLETSQRQYWQSLYVQPAPAGGGRPGPPLVHPMPLPHYENMRYHLVSGGCPYFNRFILIKFNLTEFESICSTDTCFSRVLIILIKLNLTHFDPI